MSSQQDICECLKECENQQEPDRSFSIASCTLLVPDETLNFCVNSDGTYDLNCVERKVGCLSRKSPDYF